MSRSDRRTTSSEAAPEDNLKRAPVLPPERRCGAMILPAFEWFPTGFADSLRRLEVFPAAVFFLRLYWQHSDPPMSRPVKGRQLKKRYFFQSGLDIAGKVSYNIFRKT